MWRRKTRKRKRKKEMKRVDENGMKERKNNIKNKKIIIEKCYHNIFTINYFHNVRTRFDLNPEHEWIQAHEARTINL